MSDEELARGGNTEAVNPGTEFSMKIGFVERQQPVAACGQSRDNNGAVFRLGKDQRPIERHAVGRQLDSRLDKRRSGGAGRQRKFGQVASGFYDAVR